MKEKTDTIAETSDLMKKLLAVPKTELEARERKWKRAKARPRATRVKV